MTIYDYNLLPSHSIVRETSQYCSLLSKFLKEKETLFFILDMAVW